MRYKLWLYKRDGLLGLVLQDTSIPTNKKGSYKVRDTSIYTEDNGKLVWKTASCPVSQNWLVLRKGVCIGEFAHEYLADANVSWRVLDYLWETLGDKEQTVP